jgi:hypothetical protein
MRRPVPAGGIAGRDYRATGRVNAALNTKVNAAFAVIGATPFSRRRPMRSFWTGPDRHGQKTFQIHQITFYFQ